VVATSNVVEFLKRKQSSDKIGIKLILNELMRTTSQREPVPSTSDIIQQTIDMFEKAGKEYSPIKVKNEAQAIQEIEFLLQKIDEKNDWDVQIKAIKRAMAILNGNALTFTTFYSNLYKLSDGLVKGALNLRSSLVKASCLLLTQLARLLASNFDMMGDVISPLSRQTSHGTLIIAESCKQTILNISKFCQKKSVINIICELANSKSNQNRQISSESLVLILRFWDKSVINQNVEVIMKTIQSIQSDSQQEVRNIARKAAAIFIHMFPKKSNALMSTMDQKTKKAILDTQVSFLKDDEPEPNRRKSQSPEKKQLDESSSRKPRRSSVSKVERQIVSSLENNDKPQYTSNIPIKSRIKVQEKKIDNPKISHSDKDDIDKWLGNDKTEAKKTWKPKNTKELKRDKVIEVQNGNTKIADILNTSDPIAYKETRLRKPSSSKSTFKTETINDENSRIPTPPGIVLKKRKSEPSSKPMFQELEEKMYTTNPEQSESNTMKPPRVRYSTQNKELKQIKPNTTGKRHSSPFPVSETENECNPLRIVQLEDGNEIPFIDSIESLFKSCKRSDLKTSIRHAFSGLIFCSTKPDYTVQQKSLRLIESLMKMFSKEFEEFLSSILEVLFITLQNIPEETQIVASSITFQIQSQYDSIRLLTICTELVPSNDLCKFISYLVQRKNTKVPPDLSIKLISTILPIHTKEKDLIQRIITSLISMNPGIFLTILDSNITPDQKEFLTSIKSSASDRTIILSKIPTFSNNNVPQWCKSVLNFATSLTKEDWEQTRPYLYQAISESMSCDDHKGFIYELILSLISKLGTHNYEYFLSSIILDRRSLIYPNPRKILDFLVKESPFDFIIRVLKFNYGNFTPLLIRFALEEITLAMRNHHEQFSSVNSIQTIVNTVVPYLNHDTTMVRMNAVIFIAECYKYHSGSINEILEGLDYSQQKLIEHYTNKT